MSVRVGIRSWLCTIAADRRRNRYEAGDTKQVVACQNGHEAQAQRSLLESRTIERRQHAFTNWTAFLWPSMASCMTPGVEKWRPAKDRPSLRKALVAQNFNFGGRITSSPKSALDNMYMHSS